MSHEYLEASPGRSPPSAESRLSKTLSTERTLFGRSTLVVPDINMNFVNGVSSGCLAVGSTRFFDPLTCLLDWVSQ